MIGIAGPSGSGKTALANELSAALGPARIIPVDSYYRDLSHLSRVERAQCNFDAPDAIEDGLLVEHIKALAEGNAVSLPVYDFSNHTRETGTILIEPTPCIIIEGLFALYWSLLRELYQFKVFVEASHELCLKRRIERDVAERGRTPESVREQYRQTVKPMYECYIAPTRAYADLIVNSEMGFCDMLEVVLKHIKQSTGPISGISQYEH